MELRLPKNETVAIEGNPQGLVLCCKEGIIWLTQEGDDRDRFLGADDMFCFTHGGKAVLEGHRDALVAIVPAAHGPAAAAAGARKPSSGFHGGIRLVYHGGGQ